MSMIFLNKMYHKSKLLGMESSLVTQDFICKLFQKVCFYTSSSNTYNM